MILSMSNVVRWLLNIILVVCLTMVTILWVCYNMDITSCVVLFIPLVILFALGIEWLIEYNLNVTRKIKRLKQNGNV